MYREATAQLEQLDALLGLYLEPGLRAACRVSSFSEGTLTLVTAQPGVASHVRYLARIFTQQLRQHPEFAGLKQLRVVTYAPPRAAQRRAPRQPPPLSVNTVSLLQETAGQLADPEISGALARLASRGDDRQAPQDPEKA